MTVSMKLSAYSVVLLVVLAFVAACSRAPGDGNLNMGEQTPRIAPADFTDPGAALAEGIKLLDSGETEAAIEVLNRAVELDPDLADAYFQLGIAYALIETRDAALVEETIPLTPGPGETKVKEKNSEKAFEKAVAAYKKRIDANENDHLAYFNLGRAYNKLNEDEDAARALRQAVKLNPEDTEYQTELGSILIKLAQYREAISPLKRAVDLDPENSRAINLLEDAEAGRKRVDFVTDKKDGKTASNANSNANANSAEAPVQPSNSSKPTGTPLPQQPRPTPQKTANRAN